MSLTAKALFVIERNLHRGLSLGDIAQACGVSKFHLAHAFGEATGRPVMDYVRARRLGEAAHALAGGAGDILDIALGSGYASHEAFTRAFRAQFGTAPDEVRRAGSIAGLAVAEPLRLAERGGAALEAPRFETMGERRFVGLAERARYGETQHIPGQWQRFMSGPYGEIEDKTPSIPVGIGMGGEEEGGALSYVCAAEVSRFGRVPKGLVKVTLAPASYAVFAHDGHIATLHATYAAIWNDWFPASGRKPAPAPSLERHNETFDPSTGEGGVAVWVAVEDL
jgi:AraC family transcriptional regulator